MITAVFAREEEVEMIGISVEVRGGTARFRVLVEAESIERALEIAAGQNPGKECEVAFPIEPETFFVDDCRVPVRQFAA